MNTAASPSFTPQGGKSSRAKPSTRTSSGRRAEIAQALPIIKDRLFMTITRSRPKNSATSHFFTVDHLLRYEPFFVDFGPLSLGCLYKFCELMKHKLKDKRYENCTIYYYCDKDPQKVGNACYLMAAFQVIGLNRHPADAYLKLKEFARKAVPFRDASMGVCTYRCTVEHCAWAVYRALERRFLDFTNFDVDEYEHFERVEYGDLNVIVPGKFIAFAGPHYKNFDEEGYPALTPDFYLPIWQKFGIRTIIRLNKKCYDKRIWTREGYEHHDLYFVDGTTPSQAIIEHFLSICERSEGMIAVHCKAGLGRTGSLIGCYLMKHYGWAAHECIAWLRICRPGSVIGPQQHFLEEQQPRMWQAGDEFRRKRGISLDIDPRIDNLMVYKKARARKAKRQAEAQSKANHAINGKRLGSSGELQNASSVSLSSASASTIGRLEDAKERVRGIDDPTRPLATDPGQQQGKALRDAKRRHSPERERERERQTKGSDGDVEMKNAEQSKRESSSWVRGVANRFKFSTGSSGGGERV